jgi:AcrR family transcriptional regulator
VIDAATRLFAEQGFKRVTVRSICKEAGANVAAVNYHFRDKLGLYNEVLDVAAKAIREAAEAARTAGDGKSPREKLEAYIRVHCERIFAAGGVTHVQQLIQRELQDPTAAFESLMERVFKPRFEYLCTIIAEILDLQPGDESVIHCAASIHTQVISLRPHPAMERMGKGLKQIFTVDRITRHIIAFSHAGLAAYQRRDRTSEARRYSSGSTSGSSHRAQGRGHAR